MSRAGQGTAGPTACHARLAEEVAISPFSTGSLPPKMRQQEVDAHPHPARRCSLGSPDILALPRATGGSPRSAGFQAETRSDTMPVPPTPCAPLDLPTGTRLRNPGAAQAHLYGLWAEGRGGLHHRRGAGRSLRLQGAGHSDPLRPLRGSDQLAGRLTPEAALPVVAAVDCMGIDLIDLSGGARPGRGRWLAGRCKGR